jgi:phosphatidate cytidylyltransferase
VLKQRLITAAVLSALLIAAIFYFSTLWFSALLGVFLATGAWEWARLMQPERSAATPVLPGALVAMLIPLWFFQHETGLLLLVLGLAAAGWCVVLAGLPRSEDVRPLHAHSRVMRFVVGGFLLAPPWLALVHLHVTPQYGPWHVLFLFGLVGVADSAAYFTGRAWGKHKLAPHISPGKTWEGVYGAFAVTVIYGAVCGTWFDLRGMLLVAFVTLCLVTVMFSIVGDLFESLIKRQAGAKDSGTLLPGHGGVLDRIDSLTAAAPIFTLGMWLLEGA